MLIEMAIPESKWEGFKNEVLSFDFHSNDAILTRYDFKNNIGKIDKYERARFVSDNQADIANVINMIPSGGVCYTI